MKNNNEIMPKILSIVNRFEPDNSGGCCPICANGTFAETSCDICHGTRYERKEVFEYSEHVDEGTRLCDDCTFEVRQDDGTSKRFCWVCLQEKYDIQKLRECPECFIFDNFKGKKCDWCSKLGPFWSLYKSKGFPPLSNKEKKVIKKYSLEKFWSENIINEKKLKSDQKTLQSLKEKKIISDSQCGAERQWKIANWMETRNLRKKNPYIPKREPKIHCHYDDIMRALTGDEEIIEAIFRYLTNTDDEETKEFIAGKIENLNLDNFEYEAIGGVYYILEKRIDLLEKHPKYGVYFRAFHDKNYKAQQEFLISKGKVSNQFLYSYAHEIKTRDDFNKFLYENKEWPMEIKLFILYNVWLKNDNDFGEWRYGVLQNAAPDAFTRMLAIKYAFDIDQSMNFFFHGLTGYSGCVYKNIFENLVEILSKSQLNIKSPAEGYPLLSRLAENGDPGIREVARLLTHGSIVPDLSIPERMARVYCDIRGRPIDLPVQLPLDIFGKHVSGLDCEALKNLFIKVRLGRQQSNFRDTLFDAGLYDQHYNFFQPVNKYQNVWILSKFIISGVRTGKAQDVRRILLDRINSIQIETDEIKKSYSCGKSLEIISNLIEMIGIYVTINCQKEGLDILSRLINYLNALIAECKNNNLPAYSYEWMHNILKREGEAMINDLDHFLACMKEMSKMPKKYIPSSEGASPDHSTDGNTTILQYYAELPDDSFKGVKELYAAVKKL